MNRVIESIRKRRSIRAYDAKPVPRELVNTVIEAGNEAPSAMNPGASADLAACCGVSERLE